MLVGVFLGPITGVIGRGTVGALAPVMALGLGWLGLLFGMQLDHTIVREFRPALWRFALLQAGIAFLIAAAGAALLRAALPGLDEAWLPAEAAVFTLAAVAAISAPTGVSVVVHRLRLRGPLVDLLSFSASVDALIGVLAFAMVLGVYRPAATGDAIELGALWWLTVSVLSGVLVGGVFLSLTRRRPTPEELVLFVLGVVLFGAGAGYALRLSPLLVTIVAGAVIANFSAHKRRVMATLVAWERPVYQILLILAGTLLAAPTPVAVFATVVFALWRLGAKYLGGRAATALLALPNVPANVGVGLVAQGGFTIAIAVNYVLAYRSLAPEAVDIVFTTIVALVALSEVLSPGMIRRVFAQDTRAHQLTGGQTSASVPAGKR